MKIKERKGTEKGTVVLIHGNSCSSEVFAPLFESDIPYTLIAPDLPGHGNSDRSENEEDYSIIRNCSDLLKMIGAIQDDILLVGHSLGGHYAIEIAEALQNLKGLVIFGTPPLKKPINAEEAFIPNPNIAALYMESPDDDQLMPFFEDAVVNKEVIPGLVKDFKRADPRVRPMLAKGLAQGEPSDEVAIFSRLNVPKYVIVPDKDPFINQDYLYLLQKQVSFPFTILSLSECGHYPSLETPEQFISILKEVSSEMFRNETSH